MNADPPRDAQRLAGARVVLISLAEDITCVGLRGLARVLESQGAVVQLVHLPARGERGAARYAWLPALRRLLRGATLAGLSVLAIDAPRASALSRRLAREGVPLVWGGPYPTLRPGACLDVAQYVCRGDGEDYLCELADALLRKRSPQLPAPGAVSPPCGRERFDAVPRVGPVRRWVLQGGQLLPATQRILRHQLARNPASRDTSTLAYETVTSRGCPHSCAFCGSTALDNAVPGPRLRWRSVDSVLEELRCARQAYPFLSGIGFADDCFPARPMAELERFARRYKAEVGLPFICIGSPATITPPRLQLLKEAGLRRIKMGIQSGSAATQRVLDRQGLHAQLPQALEAIAQQGRGLLPPRYDLLADLPFETLQDRLATLRLVAELPRPFRLELNSLRLMEDTPLHARAQREGWDTPDMMVSFKRIQPSYTNLLLALSREMRLSPRALRLLARPGLARTMSRGRPAQGLQAARGLARALRARRRR